MNIRFNINNEDCLRQSFVPGRKTREFFSEKINKVADWEKVICVRGHIDDKSDNGLEWELCESLGLNPARYVGRVEFPEFFIFKERHGAIDAYEVDINVKKVA